MELKEDNRQVARIAVRRIFITSYGHLVHLVCAPVSFSILPPYNITASTAYDYPKAPKVFVSIYTILCHFARLMYRIRTLN
jgi:hypothetical protein